MNQIDLMNRSLHLPAEKTKGRKARTVFFSKRTEKELRRWIQFKDRYCETEIAFPVKCTGQELKISQYEANFRRYLQRIGIQKHITPHTLRNNFAKRCLLSGMDIYTLSRILVHSSVSVTEKAYLDIHDHDLKRRYAKFSPLENIYYQWNKRKQLKRSLEAFEPPFYIFASKWMFFDWIHINDWIFACRKR